MIHTIKNYKWVIATSIVCIILGVLTFLTFLGESFIQLNDFNLQILLLVDLVLLALFFTFIIRETYKVFRQKKEGKFYIFQSFIIFRFTAFGIHAH